MQNGWIPQVNTCSAIENIGISQILENIEKFDRHMISNGWKQKKREEQNKFWLHYLIKDELGKKYIIHFYKIINLKIWRMN